MKWFENLNRLKKAGNMKLLIFLFLCCANCWAVHALLLYCVICSLYFMAQSRLILADTGYQCSEEANPLNSAML